MDDTRPSTSPTTLTSSTPNEVCVKTPLHLLIDVGL